MRRGTKCIAQTINLSNPETCIRPKRIQKLVGAEVMQPCPGAGGSSYWTPRPVSIKICTRKDMQRTCPPKLCDCPQKMQAKSANQKLCRSLLFLLKSSIAAGLVYWTHSEGLWGSSAEVKDLYCRILATIAPVLPDEYTDHDIELPCVGELKYNIIQKYNRAVCTIASYIVDASTKLQQQFRELVTPQCENESEEIVNGEMEDEVMTIEETTIEETTSEEVTT
ncbi:uncharacterized protein LOC143367999 [Andrena cerasifolii]|uniref:uncharacterized protein LOC143367999 n=1 Tax=Andrena cerasifolii TaxID=2819439 RepID=UPI004037EF8A